MKPGRVGGADRRPAPALRRAATRRAATDGDVVAARRRPRRARITGAGLKKWSPSDPLRPRRSPPRSRRSTGRSCSSRGSHRGAAAASRARKIVRFSSRSSSAASIDDVGLVAELRRATSVVAQPGEPAVDPVVDRVGVELELRRAAGEPVADPVRPRSMAAVVDVVEDDLVAGLERELGDPGAHRPGPDDADRDRDPRSDRLERLERLAAVAAVEERPAERRAERAVHRDARRVAERAADVRRIGAAARCPRPGAGRGRPA